MKSVAVVQSNYLPWKGYFDLIHDVDLFVFYDDVQYTKNDWRNRNLVKTPAGPAWITVPVGRDLHRLIREVAITDRHWAAKHWKTLAQNYGRAPYFGAYRPFFEHVYLERTWQRLSELNQYLVIEIGRRFLGVRTEFRDSAEYGATGRQSERLLDLLGKVEARLYVSGPAAQSYIDPQAFARAGIELAWKSYSGYPEYPQAHPPFTHQVSIVDLLFHVGPDAPWYIWGWREQARVRAEES